MVKPGLCHRDKAVDLGTNDFPLVYLFLNAFFLSHLKFLLVK